MHKDFIEVMKRIASLDRMARTEPESSAFSEEAESSEQEERLCAEETSLICSEDRAEPSSESQQQGEDEATLNETDGVTKILSAIKTVIPCKMASNLADVKLRTPYGTMPMTEYFWDNELKRLIRQIDEVAKLRLANLSFRDILLQFFPSCHVDVNKHASMEISLSRQQLFRVLASPAAKQEFYRSILIKYLPKSVGVINIRATQLIEQLQKIAKDIKNTAQVHELIYTLYNKYCHQLVQTQATTNQTFIETSVLAEMTELLNQDVAAQVNSLQFCVNLYYESVFRILIPKIIYQEIVHSVIASIDSVIIDNCKLYAQSLEQHVKKLEVKVSQLEDSIYIRRQSPCITFWQTYTPGELSRRPLEVIMTLEARLNELEEKVARLTAAKRNHTGAKL